MDCGWLLLLLLLLLQAWFASSSTRWTAFYMKMGAAPVTLIEFNSRGQLSNQLSHVNLLFQVALAMSRYMEL